MAMKAGIIWVDAQGERVLHVVTTSTGISSIESNLIALSHADVVEQWEGIDQVNTPSTSPGTYDTVRVTAMLTFSDGLGSVAKVYLPAPLASIFLPDGITVDPTQIASLITACIGNLLAGSGNPVTMFVGGEAIATRVNAITTLV